jgi:hypothetical protein
MRELIQSAVEKIWLNNIREDFDGNYLLNEDGLKNAFYFHLRNELQSNSLFETEVRIFTEFRIPKTKRIADTAIVKIDC